MGLFCFHSLAAVAHITPLGCPEEVFGEKQREYRDLWRVLKERR
jgi:hypothetical protein